MLVDSRNEMWAAIKLYRDLPTNENEQTMHKALDDFETASQSEHSIGSGKLAESMGDVMTHLENAIIFQQWSEAKVALEMLSKLQGETFEVGVEK